MNSGFRRKSVSVPFVTSSAVFPWMNSSAGRRVRLGPIASGRSRIPHCGRVVAENSAAHPKRPRPVRFPYFAAAPARLSIRLKNVPIPSEPGGKTAPAAIAIKPASVPSLKYTRPRLSPGNRGGKSLTPIGVRVPCLPDAHTSRSAIKRLPPLSCQQRYYGTAGPPSPERACPMRVGSGPTPMGLVTEFAVPNRITSVAGATHSAAG